MSKAYDEIMDRIVVNDDMRRRVLQNVEKQMVDGAGTGENQTKNAGMKRQPAENDTKPANNVELQEDFAVWGEEEKRLRRMRRYRISKFLSAVACLALLITGVVVLPQINRGQQEPTSDQKMVGGANGMESVASADELFQKLGFPVSDLKNLPFTVEHTEYELDQSLTSRDTINAKMRAILDEATDPWGIKVNRVELKNILPPREIQNASVPFFLILIKSYKCTICIIDSDFLTGCRL